MQRERSAQYATQAVPLVPHPGGAPGYTLVVHVRREPESLALRYLLRGDLSGLRVPPPQPPLRREGLWRHTCFELFVSGERSAAYDEFNFSPSGEWAAYRFAGYRRDGRSLECRTPAIVTRAAQGELDLQAAVDCAARGRLRLALSAVLEASDGRLSYWALRHPGATPDFHHPEGFALELDEIRH